MSGPNHHDAFVKRVFGDPEVMAGELVTFLPEALVAKLDMPTLTAEAGSFVDERLRERHTDLLFSVKLVDGRDALVYVLFEHQSSVDPLLVVRLLGYVGRIWEDWLRKHEGAIRVPPIIPLVLSQGPTPWSAATSLHEAIDVDAETLALIAAHVPQFRIMLDDLAVQSDEDIRSRRMAVLGRLALLLLRHVREARSDVGALRRLVERVADLLRLLPGAVDSRLVLTYILRVADAERPLVESALAEALPDMKDKVLSVAEQIHEEGRREGLEAGRREGVDAGRLDGLRDALLRLLGHRFPGRVTDDIERRVNTADQPTLEACIGRVLEASTIDGVFSS